MKKKSYCACHIPSYVSSLTQCSCFCMDLFSSSSLQNTLVGLIGCSWGAWHARRALSLPQTFSCMAPRLHLLHKLVSSQMSSSSCTGWQHSAEKDSFIMPPLTATASKPPCFCCTSMPLLLQLQTGQCMAARQCCADSHTRLHPLMHCSCLSLAAGLAPQCDSHI